MPDALNAKSFRTVTIPAGLPNAGRGTTGETDLGPVVVPPVLTITNLGTSSIAVLIAGQQDGDHLIPQFRVTGASTWQSRPQIAFGSASYTYTALSGVTSYDLRMLAVNPRGSEASNTVAGSTQAENPGTINLVSTGVEATEGTTIQVVASRDPALGSDGDVAVDWAVSDGLSDPASGAFSWSAGQTGNRSASALASLVEQSTQGSITLSNARRTDGGSPAPSLGISSGVVTVNDVPPPPPPGDGYTLANATAGLPFTVNTPTAPTITSEATVTPATIGANLVNGRRLILTAGSYGNLSVGGQDNEFIIGEGCTFGSVSFSGAARRIIFRVSNAREVVMTQCTLPGAGAGPQDVLIDGVNVFSEGTGPSVNRNYVKGDRIAIINSFFRMVDFPLCSFNTPPDTHIIIANCDLQNFGGTVSGHTEQAGVRFHNCDPFVFVDSRVRKEGGEKQVFRIHLGDGTDSFYTYVSRNQFENINHCWIEPEGTGATVAEIFHDVWFENNDHYVSRSYGGNFIGTTPTSEPGRILRYRVRNNNFYGSSDPSFGQGIFRTYEAGNLAPWIGDDWVIEGNTIQAYQTPPAWSFQ